MSYCRKEGKDQVIFVTKEDHEKQSASNPLLGDEDEQVGLIKPNGDINWDCPCLQGMADGPCGEPFKEAFSCFHYSVTEPKGVDCLVQFKSMQECFVKYPEIYGSLDDDENDENVQEDNKNDSEDSPSKTEQSSNTLESVDNSGQVENNLVADKKEEEKETS